MMTQVSQQLNFYIDISHQKLQHKILDIYGKKFHSISMNWKNSQFKVITQIFINTEIKKN